MHSFPFLQELNLLLWSEGCYHLIKVTQEFLGHFYCRNVIICLLSWQTYPCIESMRICCNSLTTRQLEVDVVIEILNWLAPWNLTFDRNHIDVIENISTSKSKAIKYYIFFKVLYIFNIPECLFYELDSQG